MIGLGHHIAELEDKAGVLTPLEEGVIREAVFAAYPACPKEQNLIEAARLVAALRAKRAG